MKKQFLLLLFFTLLFSSLVQSRSIQDEKISTKAHELLKESGFKVILDIDDFEGSDLEKINTAIQFANISGGGIVKITRNVLINASIIMHSNVYLLFNNTIKVQDRVFDNVIRMAGVIINPDNPNDICLDLQETTNIKILGIGEKASIEGCDIPYKGLNPKTGRKVDFIGDFYGWRTVGILLSNTKNYEIGNFAMSKTKCWAISQEWGCKDGHIHDIKFSTLGVKNGDGIDIRNGCSNIIIENITGATGDDTVACTALDKSFIGVKGGGNYVWSMQTMGYIYKEGDEAGISDITIRNINTESEHNSIRCLTTSPKVQNITISDVKCKAVHNVIFIHTGYGEGYTKGNLKDIYINNVINRGDSRTIGCEAPIVNGWFNKVEGAIFIEKNSENTKVTNSTSKPTF